MTRPVPQFSVVIPAYEQREELERCLRLLAGQTVANEAYEVILVDNGSDPPLDPARPQGLRLHVAREETPGSYAARNRGVALARGKILAFTDADCEPSPSWLGEGVKALSGSRDPAVVAGRIELFAQHPRRTTASEMFELSYGFQQQEYVEQRHYGATANLFIDREVFNEVGAFDTRLRSSGDKEWGQRAYAAGFPIIYCESALVLHPARSTLRDLWRKHRRVRGGHLQMGELGLGQQTDEATTRGLRDRILGSTLIAPLTLVARSVRDGEVRGATAIAKLLAAGIVVSVARAYETLRLALGGRPLR